MLTTECIEWVGGDPGVTGRFFVGDKHARIEIRLVCILGCQLFHDCLCGQDWRARVAAPATWIFSDQLPGFVPSAV